MIVREFFGSRGGIYFEIKCDNCGINIIKSKYRVSKIRNDFTCCSHKCTYEYKSKLYLEKCGFKEFNTQEECYWLGFLYADAYLNISEKHNLQYISFSLQLSDKEHIDKYGKFINKNTYVQKQYDKRYDKEWIKATVTLSNKELINKIRSFGFKQNKSTISTRLPKLPDNMYRHFIRGYFDGDGSILKNKREVSFSNGHPQLLIDIKDKLKEQANLEIGKIVKRKNNKGCHFSFYALSKVNKFYNYIYKDATIYLDRKKIIFDRHLNEN